MSWSLVGRGLIAAAVGYQVLKDTVGKINEERRKKEREQTTKVLESAVNEAHQELNSKMKALCEDFKKLQKSSLREVQLLRADPEKIQGKKEEKIARALEIRLKKNLRQLFQRIQTLEADLQEWPENTKIELHHRRADLEKIQGMNEEEIARSLFFTLKKNFRQLSERIQRLIEELQEWPETTKNELELLRADLEHKLGPSAQKREIIFLTRAPEFGAVHFHGDVWKERGLLTAQDFSRSVSGREVEWTTPGASDNPHGNQDQRSTFQDSPFLSSQRNMDMRASRNNDPQVFRMLTLGVLISIIILTRVFALEWS